MNKNTKIDLVILIIITILFSIISSLLSYMKYMAFNASVYDLGVSSLLIKNAMEEPVQYQKLIYFIMYPFYYLYPSQTALMAFQDTLLCFSSIPIYFTGRKIIKKHYYALIISMLWLIYFPLSGVMWFDFHFMALFPFLFLTAYMFFTYEKYQYSLIFIFLSAITDYLAPVIIIFFLISLLLKHRKLPKYYYMPVVILFITIFAMVNIFEPSYTLAFINIPFLFSHLNIIYSSIGRKIIYIIMILLPVFFIAAFVPEILMAVPYTLLMFSHDYFPYFQPILYQYPALIAPAVFISVVAFVGKYEDKKIYKLNMKRIITVAIALSIATWFLFTPVGNLISDNNSSISYVNYVSMGNYNTYNEISYHKYDSELNNIIKSIPYGSSVAIQNNMPQLVQYYNYSLPINNYNASPEYIVDDPYSVWFYNVTISGNTVSSMVNFVNCKICNGYGIVDSESGIVLLEKNYTGKIKDFVPMDIKAGNNTYINFLSPGEYQFNYNGNGSVKMITTNGMFNITMKDGIGYFNTGKYITDFKLIFSGSNIDIRQLSA
jgi:uncharacterized membrane protein